jgi:hypothetical protein
MSWRGIFTASKPSVILLFLLRHTPWIVSHLSKPCLVLWRAIRVMRRRAPPLLDAGEEEAVLAIDL